MPPSSPPSPLRLRARVRLGLAIALPLLLAIVGHALGVEKHFNVEAIRATAATAGASGVAVFVLSFCIGELLHVPGLVFVAAGVLAYGPKVGGIVSFVAAIASVSVSFWFARVIGGRPLGALRHRWARRALDHLDQRPIRTVALLRLFLILSPPLNYALALTNVRFRHYLAGSVVGLAAPIAIAVGLSDRLLEVIK